MSIGSSIDELIRHHPSLRSSVFDSIISTLKKIESMGKTYVPPNEIRHFYLLGLDTERPSAAPVPALTPNDDVEMEDARTSETPERNIVSAQSEDAAVQTDDVQSKSHDNIIINFIDAVGRV